MSSFRLILTSVEGAKFDGDAVSVTVPGAAGEMTLLAQHESIISTLRPGKITVRKEAGESQESQIKKGVMECSGNRITILL